MALSFSLSKKKLAIQQTEALALTVITNESLELQIQHLQPLFPALAAYCKQQKFTGTPSKSVYVTFSDDNKIRYIIIAGTGEKNLPIALRLENYRRAIAKIIRTAQEQHISSIALQLPDSTYFDDDIQLAYETVVSALMADYTFDTFRSNAHNKKISIALVYNTHSEDNLRTGLERGTIVADAINTVREWVNLPANMLAPEDLATHAKQLSDQYGLECTVFNQEDIQSMGMGGLDAVARGSARKPRFVTMKYACQNKKAPTICLVGKGVTFDSGGLSIKPASSMETMKEDMAGAGAVIGAMKALAQLKPTINIIAITPLTENIPSGTAAKPGDIIRIYNGKTVEIKNTDAEGRLILADALAYAVKNFKPDILIDLATLTGACQRALGPFFSGLFSTDDKLVHILEHVGQISGDALWRLPLTSDYQKAIECNVADLCNSGKASYMAGATNAAVFLQHFVGNTRWAHIDIAGTAFNVPDLPYQRPDTASGTGVRLLVQLAMTWQTFK